MVVVTRELLYRLYWEEKKNLKEIANELNLSYHYVRKFCKEMGIPLRVSNDPTRIEIVRFKINKNIPDFEKKHKLAYILGVVLGDGYFYRVKRKRGYAHLIGLNTVSKEFAESFKKALEEIGLNPSLHYMYPPSYRRRNQRGQWRVTCFNIHLYKWLKNLSLTDIEEFILSNEENIAPFVRGFYESEGYCFFGEVQSNYKYKYKYARIYIVNKKREYLELVRKCLNKLGINAHIYGPYSEKKIYMLTIYRQEDVGKFMEKIQPCIKTM